MAARLVWVSFAAVVEPILRCLAHEFGCNAEGLRRGDREAVLDLEGDGADDNRLKRILLNA